MSRWIPERTERWVRISLITYLINSDLHIFIWIVHGPSLLIWRLQSSAKTIKRKHNLQGFFLQPKAIRLEKRFFTIVDILERLTSSKTLRKSRCKAKIAKETTERLLPATFWSRATVGQKTKSRSFSRRRRKQVYLLRRSESGQHPAKNDSTPFTERQWPGNHGIFRSQP